MGAVFLNIVLVSPQISTSNYYNYNPGLYSQYNQNPSFYQNNLNTYNSPYNSIDSRFNSPYYNSGINSPFINNNPNYNSGSFFGNSFSASRNIQYTDPRFSSNSYGGFGSYNNLGQYSYTPGSGAYGGSGLYGYGLQNNQYGFNQQFCQAGQDFLIHIAPGGCEPALVRSDLLEEQNVPVFCRLSSLQTNPLLSGTRIRSLRVQGQLPEGIAGVSYYPGRAALNNVGLFGRGFGGLGGFGGGGFGSRGLGTGGLGLGGGFANPNSYYNYNQFNTGYNSLGYNTFGQNTGYPSSYSNNYLGLFGTNPFSTLNYQSSPVNDNLGYLVVVLNQQANESTLPDFVEGNITAVIDYDSTGGFGIGRTYFYLDETDEVTWQRDYRENSFWNGKGYVRAESIDNGLATISIYRDPNQRDATITLREGETSGDLFLGGNACSAAGMRIRLDRLSAPVESALLQVNNEQVWVSVGDRIINDRCRVTALNSAGGGGTVSISCPAQNGNFQLSLNGGRATFDINGVSKDVTIGQAITPHLYLGYIGRDVNGVDLAVLVQDTISNSDLSFSDKDLFQVIENAPDKTNQADLTSRIKSQYRQKIIGPNKQRIDSEVNVIVLQGSSSYQGIRLANIFTLQDANFNENPAATTYYQRAVTNYQDLADFYPHETLAQGELPLAAQGIHEAYNLALDFKRNNEANQLSNTLVSNYPDSYLADSVRNNRNYNFKYDRTNAKKILSVDGSPYSIDLLEFRKPKRTDANAIFLIDGVEATIGLGEFYNVNDVNMQLIHLNNDRAQLSYDYTDANGNRIRNSNTLFLGQQNQVSVNGVNVRLNQVNLREQARVSIFPSLYGSRTEAHFLVRIGIEKRAIELSPKRTKKLIENLEDTIKTWQELNGKLENTIKALKGACFATSAILTVKNFFEGSTGSSLARNRIMTASGGWNDQCEELVNQKVYLSLQQCLLDKSDEIQNDVNVFSSEIERTNEALKKIKDRVGVTHSDALDFQGQTDAKQVESLFKNEEFEQFCRNQNGFVKLPGAGGEQISYSGQGGICDWDSMTHEQRREILTLSNMRGRGSEVLNKYIDNELGRVTLEAKNLNDITQSRLIAEKNAERYNLGVKTTNPVGDTITYGSIKSISTNDIVNNNLYGSNRFEKGDNVVRIYIPHQKQISGGEPFTAQGQVGGREVIVKVSEIQGNAGIFSPDSSAKVYTIDGRELSQEEAASVFNYMSLSGLSRIREGNLKAYENQMVDAGNLRVKYFDRAPFRGLPSLIPFDVDQGWYVQLSYVLGGFGVPYDESGRVTNFYICNVGPNGLIEFKKSSDDICRYYNGVNSDLSFPGMNQGESVTLLQRAQQAISEASRQYGQDRVNVNGRSFESGVSFDSTEGQCTDFMSPQDCNIMFNVCDPVICPPSRCDLGGRYRVDNVIQTGIVGSLALCLPNIQEGVAVPICLTGVHAGLEGYVSILNSTVQCLNESLETGRNIGICDEIKSVYMCDFFWRQATPFMEVLLERGFEILLGQGARGGGEYLTVQNAFDNTRRSVDFFTQNYAVNSVQAFLSRSIADVQPITSFGSGAYGGVGYRGGTPGYYGAGQSLSGGFGGGFGGGFNRGIGSTGSFGGIGGFGGFGRSTTSSTFGGFAGNIGGEICKSFISSGAGGSISNIFDSLIEPDSPEQYHAWFSENVLTTGTVPPTSHYKVYFNIFAGNDIGTYYSVYLKDAPVTPGIFTANFFTVDQGYVPRGGSVDKARDFTATSGFRQLCININGREECGFGSVSTSFALNSLSDAYVKEQATQNIISERECVAGSPSLYSLAQPNIQAGAEQILQPQLYNKGIVRVCSTESPGKQVLPDGQFDRTRSAYDTWQDVGYCDDPTIRCWLNTNSVRDVVRDTQTEQQIIDQAALQSIGTGGFFIPDQSEAILNEADLFIRNQIPILFSQSQNLDQSVIDGQTSGIVNSLTQLSGLGSNNLYRARAFYLLANLNRRIAELLNVPQAEIVVTPDSSTILDSGIQGGTGAGSQSEVIPVDLASDSDLQEGLVIMIQESIYPNPLSYRYTGENGWLTTDGQLKDSLSSASYLEGVNLIASQRIGPNTLLFVNDQRISNDLDSLVNALR